MGIYFGLNPEDQNAHNVLKIRMKDSGCCGDERQVCQYASQPITNALEVKSLHGKTPSGNSFVKTFSPAPVSASDIKNAIDAALTEVGYELEGKNGTFVVTGPTEKIVYINTDGVMTKLVVDTNTDRTFTCENNQSQWVIPS